MFAYLKNVLDAVVPSACALCGAGAPDPICHECLTELNGVGETICIYCGKQTEVSVDRCRHCRGRRISYASHRSIYLYDKKMRAVIHKMKYFKRKDVALFFGRHIFEQFRSELVGSYVICHVPSSLQGFKDREYDQVELLTRGFMQGHYRDLKKRKDVRYELKPGLNIIQKIKDGPHQHKLAKKDRIANVKGMFVADHRPAGSANVAILIDDVYTSGSTINECSLALKKAGYKKVLALTLARTPGIYL